MLRSFSPQFTFWMTIWKQPYCIGTDVTKPEINELKNEPRLRVRPALLDHAITFAPHAVLKLEDLRTSDRQLDHLEIFPAYRFNLAARGRKV